MLDTPYAIPVDDSRSATFVNIYIYIYRSMRQFLRSAWQAAGGTRFATHNIETWQSDAWHLPVYKRCLTFGALEAILVIRHATLWVVY